jgi:hypothetical protein
MDSEPPPLCHITCPTGPVIENSSYSQAQMRWYLPAIQKYHQKFLESCSFSLTQNQTCQIVQTNINLLQAHIKTLIMCFSFSSCPLTQSLAIRIRESQMRLISN